MKNSEAVNMPGRDENAGHQKNIAVGKFERVEVAILKERVRISWN